MDRIGGSFNIDIGRNLGRDKNGAKFILQYLGTKDKRELGRLYARNSQ